MQKFFSTLDQALKKAESDTIVTKQGGLVRSVKDGVILIEGLDTLSMGEIVTVGGDDVKAMVVQIGTEETYAVTLEPADGIKVGQEVVRTGRVLDIQASESLLGRVIDPMGNALDGKGEIAKGTPMPLEALAPSVMTRKPVSTPVATGIVAIDALIPIGRGQRELIIGDRQTGKTTIALDTILNQKGQDMVCVYVAIGQRDAKVAQVIKTLSDQKALDYTIVVNASASSPAMLQFLAPYAGVAAAEYFMQKGRDVLVVYDDLSKHAVAYREVSLLLRKPPGREAYPGDVFYIHSRLLERAARLDDKHGGGSITALPIIETQAGDISAYIPTNVISITDGQIFLEPSLFYRGVRPAINVGTSVSRVGSAAQTKIMKKISGTAKLDLAQYYELAAFSQFASELDEKSKQQLTRGSRLEEALKQKPGSPRHLWQEAVILWFATKGYLDKVEQEQVSEKITSVLTAVEASEGKLVKQIEEKQELTEEIAIKLDEIAKKYVV